MEKNPIFIEKSQQLLKEEEKNGKISIIPMYSSQAQEIDQPKLISKSTPTPDQTRPPAPLD